MAKKESSFSNMLLALAIIALISSASLGFVYELTKKPIEEARLAKQNEAIQSVLPAFDNNPVNQMYKKGIDGDTLIFFPAYEDSVLVGTAVRTFSPKGFGGDIFLMVGFLPDGTINKIAVLEHHETPGLGDKMDPKKSNFSVQFDGKNPKNFKLSVTKDGGDVQAITAATISSRAFCDAVQRAYNALMEGDKP